MTIENDKICSMVLNTKDHILGENNKSGLIIQESSYFNRLSHEHKLECHFRIQASFNFGLFAVIQKMNLRRDLNTNECLDYVQVSSSLICLLSYI